MRFVLIHSPAVGPTTWRWVAGELGEAGHRVHVPDLVTAALSGDPRQFVNAAAEAVESLDPLVSDDGLVIVGHSGAGPLLALIGNRLTVEVPLVFVDAGLPPCSGSYTVGGEFVGTLRSLAVNGVLPIWSRWFGEGVLERVVADSDRRVLIERELPELPIRFYESPLDAPAGWCEGRHAYALLSEGYRSDLERALAMGWDCAELVGTHLDIVNEAPDVASMLIELARSLTM